MARTVTFTAARQNLAAICDEVVANREEFVIRRSGAEDVALISAAELRSINETAYLLSSPRNALRLISAMESVRTGKGKKMTVAQLRRELGLAKSRR